MQLLFDVFMHKHHRPNMLSCYCCIAYLSSSYRETTDTIIIGESQTFHFNDYFVLKGIRTCLRNLSDPINVRVVFVESCPRTLLFVQSLYTEKIIIYCLNPGCGLNPVHAAKCFALPAVSLCP